MTVQPLTAVGMVAPVGNFPAVIGDQQQAVHHQAHAVVDRLPLAEGLVAALVGNDPDAGSHSALQAGEQGGEVVKVRGAVSRAGMPAARQQRPPRLRTAAWAHLHRLSGVAAPICVPGRTSRAAKPPP